MTRLYGRAFSNERVNEYVPDVRFERTSVIGALGVAGIIAPLTYKGTLDGKLFGKYVKKCLAPEMKEGDTLILDNASAHKVGTVMEPLIEKGIADAAASKDNVNRFVEIIRKYSEPLTVLTREVVLDLIEKIVIHEPMGVSHQRNKKFKLEIHYRFIGSFRKNVSL
ncbi:hypothetical protein AGMMS49992_04500 [Clostridia bacterium]|nr:hypothetical protein AGMMS49992_04500 [Clostridia bacterium]